MNKEKRLIISGIEHVVYGGRVMPIIAGGAPTLEELEDRHGQVVARLKEIDAENAGQYIDPQSDAGKEWGTLAKEREELERSITQGRQRQSYLQALAEDPEAREDGATFHVRPPAARGQDIYDLSTVRTSVASPEAARNELTDRARRSIESSTFPHERADDGKVRAHLESLLATRDTETGDLARHLLATGSPTYMRAFGKSLQGKPLSEPEMRALSSVPAEGGYAVPYTLDPTIIPTSNGAVNPLRAISRVESIVTNEWRGVSSDGITATRAAEKAEAGDNSPTLAQPVVRPTKVHAFVPFSIEIGQDWGSLQAEMARLLQDAKDQEEAESYINGDGTGENPNGVIATLGAGSQVETGAIGTFGVGDLYKVKGALPPRFRPLAKWLANDTIYSLARQFDTSGGADLWVQLGDDRPPRLIGKPVEEASEMSDTVAASELIALIGDFRYFLIVDRIGMTIEVVPHLFGANRRPTGERGIYAYWRNNSKILSDNAFRLLKVRAA